MRPWAAGLQRAMAAREQQWDATLSNTIGDLIAIAAASAGGAAFAAGLEATLAGCVGYGCVTAIAELATEVGAAEVGIVAPRINPQSSLNGSRLNSQYAAEEIASGHAFQKHVLEQGEFTGLGIRTRQQFSTHVENVLENPSSVRFASDGRSFYLQESTGTVVIRNPNAPDGGTAFQPQNWDDYIVTLPSRTIPY